MAKPAKNLELVGDENVLVTAETVGDRLLDWRAGRDEYLKHLRLNRDIKKFYREQQGELFTEGDFTITVVRKMHAVKATEGGEKEAVQVDITFDK